MSINVPASGRHAEEKNQARNEAEHERSDGDRLCLDGHSGEACRRAEAGWRQGREVEAET